MTDKRFTMGGTNNNIWIKDNCEDNRHNKYLLKNLNEVAYLCMILNELYDKNQKLRLERDVYESFGNDVLKILRKYEINSLEKLDRILMEQRVW